MDPMRWAANLMPDIQITVSPAVMGTRFARWLRAGMNSRLDRMDWLL